MLCPDTPSSRALTLCQWHSVNFVQCSVVLEGKVSTLPLLRDQSQKQTRSAILPLIAYWVTGAPDPMVSTNDVVPRLENQTAASITDCYQEAALDAHDFAAILCMVHTQYHDTRTFVPRSH